jgi:ubiquinone/menaquinone biosynthesis C-methylase UbiE
MTSGVLTRWFDAVLRKPLRRLVETPRRMLKGYVAPGMTVVDVGCGSGDHSLGMARLVGPNGRVVSVDTDAESIATLKERAARAKLSERIEARVCTEQDLGIHDLAGQIDFALAIYVVHHAADPAGLMRNVHGALKPGGTLMVVEPRHHASPAECQATESAAQAAGFKVIDHPQLWRDWAVRFEKA